MTFEVGRVGYTLYVGYIDVRLIIEIRGGGEKTKIKTTPDMWNTYFQDI